MHGLPKSDRLTFRRVPGLVVVLAALSCGGKSAVGGSGSGSLNVWTTGLGSGTVASSSGPITCSLGFCKTPLQGSTTLTASAKAGSTFMGWEGDCTGQSCTVGTRATSATARFGLPGAWSKVATAPIGDSQIFAAARTSDGGVLLLGANPQSAIDYGGKTGQYMSLAKYDAGGALLWLKVLPGNVQVPYGSDNRQFITTDANGNIFLTGAFSGTLNLGGSNLTSAGGLDIFVASFDSAGTHRWSARFGGTGDDTGVAVAVDATGNVALTGRFINAVTFGTTSFNYVDTTTFVLRLSPSGAVLWAVATSGNIPNNTTIVSYQNVGCDPSGNVWIAGHYGGMNVSLFKFAASNGAKAWDKVFTASPVAQNGTHVKAMAMDGSGGAILVGSLYQSIDFGGGPVSALNGMEILVARFDSSGTVLWAKTFDSSQPTDYADGVAVDGKGNIYLTGQISSTSNVDLGSGPFYPINGPAAFVAELSPAGVPLWSRAFYGAALNSSSEGHALGVDAAGDVAVAGVLSGSVDLGDAVRTAVPQNALFVVAIPAAR
jgi:hypothetical protein